MTAVEVMLTAEANQVEIDHTTSQRAEKMWCRSVAQALEPTRRVDDLDWAGHILGYSDWLLDLQFRALQDVRSSPVLQIISVATGAAISISAARLD